MAMTLAEDTAVAALRSPPAMSGVTFGDDVAEAPQCHPLFPEVNTATMHMHRGIDEEAQPQGADIPRPPGSRDMAGTSRPALNQDRSPF